MLSIIGFIIIGIIAGYLGRLLMPGEQKMGFVGTALLGMVGSLIGGTLGTLLFGDDGFGLSAAGIIGSIIGVLIVLFVLERTGKV
ncbi:MAG: GlsB/YeaQ/YmgE family stress response membrane protein [Nitriliruptor sp.]|uniref:GlsB/YeaQ/YmgE family stress response membrane protein n=1 Tax=Nitriliruptor sp. TaxID=2448056 RepID=UPI0034A05A13